MSTDRERRRDRIVSIAEQLIAGQLESGDLDEKDTAAMKIAIKQAVRDARAAYDAAAEYISG